MACDFIGWCALGASAQAAWAQAVLSILAVMVAIYVPARMARNERLRRAEAIVRVARGITSEILKLRTVSDQDSDHPVPDREMLSGLHDSGRKIVMHEVPVSEMVEPFLRLLSSAQTILLIAEQEQYTRRWGINMAGQNRINLRSAATAAAQAGGEIRDAFWRAFPLAALFAPMSEAVRQRAGTITQSLYYRIWKKAP